MVTDLILDTLGGLALFLFGMGLLSDGLKKSAGDRLRRLLQIVTKWRVMALLAGAGVTCLIQSSSATTVMVVGLVNAGLLSLKQAICVILGANIGTTFTAWLVGLAAGLKVFKITAYALPAVAVGLTMQIFGKRQKVKYAGQIFIGFGILFLGIHFMKDAFAPLEHSERAKSILIAIGDRPVLGVLAGAIITMLLQSSSASIAMIQVLALTGAFGGTDWTTALRIAIPFILGDNIGTTITAQIAALRTNIVGRRAAMAHTLFNVLGVAVILPLVYLGLFDRLVRAITPLPLNAETIAIHIAVAHSAFNVVASVVFLPLAGLLERLVTRITPARAGELLIRPVTLERHLLNVPPVAIDQARREIVRMAETARDALDDAVAALCHDDRTRLARVGEQEDRVDDFQTEITRYLVELSQRDLSSEIANELPVLLHTVNDVERIADHAVNIAEIATRKIDQREQFSPDAQAEIALARAEVEQMFADILQAVGASDTRTAERALGHEDRLNQMQIDFRRSHVMRLSRNACSPIAGLIFVDFVDNLEKIGDHLANIAQGVIGGLQWNGKPPARPAEVQAGAED